MASQDVNKGANFFKTLSSRLKSENINFSPPSENRLTVLLNGWPAGRAFADGSTHFKVGYLDTTDARDPYFRVKGIAAEVHGEVRPLCQITDNATAHEPPNFA